MVSRSVRRGTLPPPLVQASLDVIGPDRAVLGRGQHAHGDREAAHAFERCDDRAQFLRFGGIAALGLGRRALFGGDLLLELERLLELGTERLARLVGERLLRGIPYRSCRLRLARRAERTESRHIDLLGHRELSISEVNWSKR